MHQPHIEALIQILKSTFNKCNVSCLSPIRKATIIHNMLKVVLPRISYARDLVQPCQLHPVKIGQLLVDVELFYDSDMARGVRYQVALHLYHLISTLMAICDRNLSL
jgi:hypothetical protein